MRTQKLILLLICCCNFCLSQGLNHTWLLGYWPYSYDKGRINFTSSSDTLIIEKRLIPFDACQANISDSAGNLLISSNGVWIANKTGDTLKGGGKLLNFAGISFNKTFGVPFADAIIPYPDDSTKFVLFHQTITFDGKSYPSYGLYCNIIDISLDSGRGEVIIKDSLIFADTTNWGIGLCKHGNGRDWWIVLSKHNTSEYFKILFTDKGVQNISSQILNFPYSSYNVMHLCFSLNGDRFCTMTYDSLLANGTLVLADFDRCNGTFSTEKSIQLDDYYLWGNAFSPSGELVYANGTQHIYQVDYNTLSFDTVAVNDTFYSPNPPFQTDFLLEYLAADGKIYLTSGNGVQALHYINLPDSQGKACDVHQHDIALPFFNFRTVPNHPNYYLGALAGSACDTLGLAENYTTHDFKASVFPNPSNGQFKISYLLPQNKSGTLELFDLLGSKIYSQNLPQWSTMQNIYLKNVASGMYLLKISSGDLFVVRKIIVEE
nr:T9SS type A sorting domain-containing protein [Bacteroidota bacterium]